MCLENHPNQPGSQPVRSSILKTKIINLFFIPLLHVLLVSVLAMSELGLDQMLDYLHLYFAYHQFQWWSAVVHTTIYLSQV